MKYEVTEVRFLAKYKKTGACWGVFGVKKYLKILKLDNYNKIGAFSCQIIVKTRMTKLGLSFAK